LRVFVLSFKGFELSFTFGFKTLQQLTLLKRRGIVDALHDSIGRDGGQGHKLALFLARSNRGGDSNRGYRDATCKLALFLARSNRSGDEHWDILDGVYCGL